MPDTYNNDPFMREATRDELIAQQMSQLNHQPIVSAPRQAGQSRNNLTRSRGLMVTHSGLLDAFRQIPSHLFEEGKVIMFETTSKTNSKRRFRYVALWVNNHWYITGQGLWYGTNELTHEQMLEVLWRREVTNFAVVTEFAQDDGIPF